MDVIRTVVNNVMSYVVEFVSNDKEQLSMITIPVVNWKKSVIINNLIRYRYSQDQVEAIINNHFLNIAEWLDAKFRGEEVKFSDPDYEEFQAWRKKCKTIADEALSVYPEY